MWIRIAAVGFAFGVVAFLPYAFIALSVSAAHLFETPFDGFRFVGDFILFSFGRG
jgi:hypothetical protein